MPIVKNPVLLTLQRMLGLAPGGGRPLNLDDSNISLTLPVVPHVARRGGAGIQAGWFLGVMENVHSAADAEASFIDPYEPGALLAVAPYPASVPDGFDLWLLGCSGVRSLGTGDPTGALFVVNPNDTSQAWGIDDAGVAVIATPGIRVAFFDSVSEVVQAVTADPLFNSVSGQTYIPVNMRLPRGTLLGFETQSAAAAEYQGAFLLGLFPAGLGQDVVA